MTTSRFNEMARDRSLREMFLMVGVLVLSVAGQEQRFTAQPRDTYVLPGESATLYCHVANKTGIVFWEKDSTILFKENGPGSGFSGPSTPWAIFGDASQGEFNLQLIEVSMIDQGLYVCKVTSSSGPQAANLTSSAALLTVLDLPREEFPLCVMSIRDALTQDDVVELTCAYLNNSTTRTTLTWERLSTPADLSNSQQISREDGYFIKRHTITLGVEDDASSYQCIASRLGRDPLSCTTGILNVRHRPVITVSPLFLPAKTGDDARFTCSLSSANPPTVTYQWYYRGAAVTTSSSGIDLIQTSEGDSQILINNLEDPTGGISVVCEATNEVGTSRVEGLISLEETEIATISSEELILWLVPISVMVTIVVLLIFLGIVVLDCCPCCYTFCNKKGRRRPLSPDRSMNSTWSGAENYGMSPSPMARRLSDADSTDFYVTRAIRTPHPDETRDTSHHNSSGESRARSDRYTDHRPQSNYRTPSPNYRSRSPNYRTPSPETQTPSPDYYHSTPNGRPLISRDQSRHPDTRLHYEQRRPRNDRTRDHFRRSGQPANGSIQPADSDIRSATRNSALSDSGLDFNASSSMDSRSPTPRDDRVVYAQIMRNRTDDGQPDRTRSTESRTENASPDLPAGTPLPTSSTSRPRSALEVPTEGMHRAHSVELPTS
ncbi:uncharacterized protein LOC119745646 [Patiria miniata]|uniref:Ig-like domain-containing protein n=1 Tax=Patiria miniata TaxID=46514 RepID=A0A914BP80_PATMI|nr:uncharacterized protein LOC119745646 [Patiria miniata]